jgi:hypothetical protein
MASKAASRACLPARRWAKRLGLSGTEGFSGMAIALSDTTEQMLGEIGRLTHPNELTHLARLSTLGEMAASLVHVNRSPPS